MKINPCEICSKNAKHVDDLYTILADGISVDVCYGCWRHLTSIHSQLREEARAWVGQELRMEIERMSR
jgi:ribosome-binding protein aMBF1 (putative translation factor)